MRRYRLTRAEKYPITNLTHQHRSSQPLTGTAGMKQQVNILYIIDYLYGMGGTERHLLYLLQLLDRKRFSCQVVAFDTGRTRLTDEIRALGVPLVHIPVGRYYTPNALRRAVELYRLIRRERIDLVQTFHYKADVYGAPVARLAGVRAIVSSKRDVADQKNRLHFFLHRLVAPIVSRYIVVADGVGRVVREREKAPADKLVTIYNGVDLERFVPLDSAARRKARQKLGLGPDDLILGTVAWMRPEKNYDLLFAAFAKALEQVPELKLVAVGGGPLFDRFREEVRQGRLAEQVVLAGPADDVRPWLQVFDMACLVPGSNEGFSNAVIEKMAMGLPLIVTDVGGNAEAVRNGDNGIVIPPGDRQKLTDAIVHMARHADERKAMGCRSRQIVERSFTLDRMISAHESLYASLV